MATTLTIVARRPDAGGALETDAVIDEQDAAIAAIMDAMRNRDKTTHRVMRASTVEQVRKCLQAYGQPPDVLQIVGHGMSGMLSLGARWLKTIPKDNETYYLDSDPDTYSILYQVVAKPTKVLLLGCSLGESDVPTSAVPDGPVLLFDLCRMWQTSVSGPMSPIDVSYFSDRGVFFRNDDLATADGLAVALPLRRRNPPSTRARTQADTMKFADHGLATAPGLGVYMPVAVDGANLSTEPFVPIVSTPILGMPELVVDVMLAGKQGQANMLANGRLLLVRRGGLPDETYLIGDVARNLLFAARDRGLLTKV